MANFDGWGRERKAPPRFRAIDDAVKAKGTVTDFARKTGLNLQTYYCMQSGRAQPTLTTVRAVLAYTGLPFEVAFDE